MSYDEVTPEAALFATMERHRIFVRRALQSIRHDLERRELVHDESKYRPDELPGFVRLNRAARNHPYGSEGYKSAITAEDAPKIHQQRNSHHPEAHSRFSMPMKMGWLDIIEMVCDWWSANQAYGGKSFRDSLDVARERWEWTDSQWWLIEQVAEHLECVAGAE